MNDLKSRFEEAVENMKGLPQRPDNASLLKAYALYKQATQGDVTGERPGFSDLIGRAKWDAWQSIKGTDAASAMAQYVDLYEDLAS